MHNDGKKYLRVLEKLKKDILSGKLAPGQRLPGQNVLGSSFGVSPITSKRVLAELEKQGFIERRPRSGSYVRSRLKMFSEVNIVIGDIIENESLWLGDYWRGIEDEAAKLDIPTRIIRHSAPGFAEQVLCGPADQGVILLGDESYELLTVLRERRIPHVLGLTEARYVAYNVMLNYRVMVAELADAMRRDGARHVIFLGNLRHPSHRFTAECFTAVQKELGLKGKVVNVSDENIQEQVVKLLKTSSVCDGMIIMGGGLPFRALPSLLKSKRQVMLGVFTENPAVRELRGIAYIADYQIRECGELLFKLLYETAVNRKLPPTTRFPGFKILNPFPADDTDTVKNQAVYHHPPPTMNGR